MKAMYKALLGVALLGALALVVRAEEKPTAVKADKEVTLKGDILCAKCKLKETSTCTNAIRVKEEGKEVVYYLKDAGAKAPYHSEICTAVKPGSVTGTVSREKDKQYITPAKDGVKFD